MQHQFFQGFIPQQEQSPLAQMSPEMRHNIMVLEFENNWEEVISFFDKMMKGNLTEVDAIQTDWISFINSNMLNMNSYASKEEFVEKMEKTVELKNKN
jgi:hypothetical protein